MKLHLEMASIDTGHLKTIVGWHVSIWIHLGVFVSQKQRKRSDIKKTSGLAFDINFKANIF